MGESVAFKVVFPSKLVTTYVVRELLNVIVYFSVFFAVVCIRKLLLTLITEIRRFLMNHLMP